MFLVRKLFLKNQILSAIRNPNHQHRPDIDGLRAIAVMAVVLFHSGTGVSGGYVGVDVFFVISGFLITKIILKDIQDGQFSYARFLERRVRRILPALIVVVLFSLGLGWDHLWPDDFISLAKSAQSVFLLVSNFYFFHDSGYFTGAAEFKPLLHTWSLSVELDFLDQKDFVRTAASGASCFTSRCLRQSHSHHCGF